MKRQEDSFQVEEIFHMGSSWTQKLCSYLKCVGCSMLSPTLIKVHLIVTRVCHCSVLHFMICLMLAKSQRPFFRHKTGFYGAL